MLFARRLPHLARRIGVVGERVVAGGEERRSREAPAMVAVAGEHEGAGQVDSERAQAGERQGERVGGDRHVELGPGGPQRRQPRH